MTLHDRYIRYFTQAKQYVIVKTDSSKYTTLKGKNYHGNTIYVFVGFKSSVRVSTQRFVTQSYSCSKAVRIAMEQWEKTLKEKSI